jgi:hypothetical protein
MVVCIPSAEQACGNSPFPNPDIEYAQKNEWVPHDYSPGVDWQPSYGIPDNYYRGHILRFMPDNPTGKWLLFLSIDPDNFIQESNESNNTQVLTFDSTTRAMQNGLSALEKVIKKNKKLPEGLTDKMLLNLRQQGGKALTPAPSRPKLKTAGTQRQVGRPAAKQASKFGAMVKKQREAGSRIAAAVPPEPIKPPVFGDKLNKLPGNHAFGNKAATSQRKPQTLARIGPQQLGARLVLKDINRGNTLKQTAGQAFDLAFPLSNNGDAASDRTSYSLACTARGGGAKCPFTRKPGTLAALAAGKNGEIKLRGLKFPAGDYELKLKLADGTATTVRLEVADASTKPAILPKALKSKPAIKLQPDNDRPPQAPRLRLP